MKPLVSYRAAAIGFIVFFASNANAQWHHENAYRELDEKHIYREVDESTTQSRSTDEIVRGGNGESQRARRSFYDDYRYGEFDDSEYRRVGGEDGYSGFPRREKSSEEIRKQRERFQKIKERLQKENRELPEPDEEEESSERSGTMPGWLQVLLIVLGAGVLAWVIYLLIKNRGVDKGPKIKATEDDRAPAEIPKTELELALEKALGSNNFREAIRIQFIFILRDLSQKGWIAWEKEKTNLHYLREMIGRQEHRPFSDVVTIFEIVWYGNRELSEQDYKSVAPRFKSLLNKLGVK